ncbi:MAG TPA: GNAT family N-acetyltransferase [Blastocatellia bacterium]|jgi:GNAT superfamily N-acetyltransferase
MRIRTAVPDDAPAVASTLFRAFLKFEPPYTPEAFAATVSSIDRIRLRLNEGPIWAPLRDEAVVGTVSVVPKGDALYVRGMAVAPVARGRGIGCSLIKRVEARATERGFERLYLNIAPFLVGAIRLYEKCGFVRSADGPDDLFGTPLFAMEKKLSE